MVLTERIHFSKNMNLKFFGKIKLFTNFQLIRY
jgi:hypothetical protein